MCVQGDRVTLRMCVYEKFRACMCIRVCVCVCALWGETVNYLHSQTPDNAATVQGRASASGKQPSSLLFYLFCLRFLPSSLHAMLPTPFSPSTYAQSIIANSVCSVCSVFSHVMPSSFLWNLNWNHTFETKSVMFLSQGHVTKPSFEIEHGIKYAYQFYCTFLLNMKSLQFQVDLPETVSQRDRQWRVNLRKQEKAQKKKKNLKRASEWSWRMSASSWSIPLFLVTPLPQRTIVSPRFNLPFAPSEGQLARETQEWEEGGVRTRYKMKSGEAKRRPSESPCFSSRPLMCCETGGRGE